MTLLVYMYGLGNFYFPKDALKPEFFKLHKGYHTTCGWKGVCECVVAVCGGVVLRFAAAHVLPITCRSYYDLVVGASTVAKATWVYEDPKPRALYLKGHYAFCES